MLTHISNILMQKGVSAPDAGLLHGKMGLVIFLFHYAQYTGDKSFEDHAMDLLDHLHKQIIQQHVFDYADGLAGIGVGVEYLAQNNFIQVDTDAALEDFDKAIWNAVVFGERHDVSLFTGLLGLSRYCLYRVTGRHINNEHIGTLNNKMILVHLTDIFERSHPFLKESEIEDVLMFLLAMNQATIFPVKTKKLIELFSSSISQPNQEDIIGRYRRNIEVFYSTKYNELLSKSEPDIAPGLYGGLAGIGLFLLSRLDKQHETWMKLL